MQSQQEPVIDDFDKVACPVCGTEQTDMDGFGFLDCSHCLYCTHASISDGVCDGCGRNEAEMQEADKVYEAIKQINPIFIDWFKGESGGGYEDFFVAENELAVWVNVLTKLKPSGIDIDFVKQLNGSLNSELNPSPVEVIREYAVNHGALERVAIFTDPFTDEYHRISNEALDEVRRDGLLPHPSIAGEFVEDFKNHLEIYYQSKSA